MKKIYWVGHNTNGSKEYTAAANSYQELYQNIIEKYGENFLQNDIFEIKVLEANGEDVHEWSSSDGIDDYEAYEDWVSVEKFNNLKDVHFKEMISESNGNAFYQEFYEDVAAEMKIQIAKLKAMDWQEFAELQEVEVEGGYDVSYLYYNDKMVKVDVEFIAKKLNSNFEVIQEGHDENSLWEDEDLIKELHIKAIKKLEEELVWEVL